MRLPVHAALVALVALLSPPARAVEPVLAARVGLAGAVGSAAENVSMADVVPVQVPLQLDVLVAYRDLSAGIYGAWAPARAGRCAGASCTAWAARLGLQAAWTFHGDGGSAPWVGVASGYQWVSLDRTRDGTVTTRYEGFEPFAVQGGIEWPVVRWLALGPYALASIGRYARYSVDTGVEQASASIPHRAFHGWLEVGVRGRLAFGDRR
jgi:outer membrane protein